MQPKSKSLPDIRGLEAFVAVIASGSMTAAARMLGIGQPGITRIVRDLEQTLGFDLFTRNGPRITPTARGLLFYEDAQRFLQSYERISERATRLRDTRIESLTLAATPTMAAGIAPGLLAAVSDDLPDLVNLPTLDAEHLAHCLLTGAADYGLSALPLAGDDLECILTMRATLVAALPADAQARPITLAQLAQGRLISVGNTYRIRHRLNAAFGAAGLSPCQELVTNSSLNAMMAARAGLGIAVVDPVSARGIPVAGLQIVPLETEIPYEWGLFRRRGGALETVEDRLVAAFAHLSQELGGQIATH